MIAREIHINYIKLHERFFLTIFFLFFIEEFNFGFFHIEKQELGFLRKFSVNQKREYPNLALEISILCINF